MTITGAKPILQLLFLLAISGLANIAFANPLNHSERAPLMNIQIEFAKNRYISNESMQALVTISNHLPHPIDAPDPGLNDNWQPRYTVTGPSYPKGYSFSFRSVVTQDPNPAPTGLTPVTVHLEPGQSYQAELSMEQLVPFPEPGIYSITAELDWNGMQVKSAPVSFEIERPKFSAFQLTAKPGLQQTYPVQVMCLAVKNASAHAFLALFAEDSTTENIELQSLAPYIELNAEAKTLFTPWLNYDGIGMPSLRLGWQTGASLAVAEFRKNPLRLNLPWQPRLLAPALMSSSGDLDVFALNEAAPTLALLRFPPYPDSETGEHPANPLWSISLEHKPVVSRAALTTEQQGDARLALLLADSSTGTLVTLVNAAVNGGKPTLRSAFIKDLHPVKNFDPGLSVANDGGVHGAALLSSPNKELGQDIYIIDLLWLSATEADAQITKQMLTSLKTPPIAGAAAYSLPAANSARRDWLIVLADGRIISSASPGVPHSLQGKPAIPLQLLPMSRITHILTVKTDGKPGFERI